MPTQDDRLDSMTANFIADLKGWMILQRLDLRAPPSWRSYNFPTHFSQCLTSFQTRVLFLRSHLNSSYWNHSEFHKNRIFKMKLVPRNLGQLVIVLLLHPLAFPSHRGLEMPPAVNQALGLRSRKRTNV